MILCWHCSRLVCIGWSESPLETVAVGSSRDPLPSRSVVHQDQELLLLVLHRRAGHRIAQAAFFFREAADSLLSGGDGRELDPMNSATSRDSLQEELSSTMTKS